MPSVVLRHPDVELPLILDIPDGALVSRDYADAGWVIDHDTEAHDAALELPKPVKTRNVKAKFAPVVSDAPDVPAEQTPAVQTAAAETSKPAPNAG